MEIDQQQDLPSKGLQRSKFVIMISSFAYAIWLLWLAYVAWVNVTAGNQ